MSINYDVIWVVFHFDSQSAVRASAALKSEKYSNKKCFLARLSSQQVQEAFSVNFWHRNYKGQETKELIAQENIRWRERMPREF